jgi:hypothetical protein
MKRVAIATILGMFFAGAAFAQTSPPPRPLPPSLADSAREKPAKPLSPADVARQREATIRDLKENLLAFDPQSLTAERVDGRWLVRTGKEILKDYGPDRSAALEASRCLQDLRFNQLGSIPGSNPPFEYWLLDGKAARGSNAKLVVIPVAAQAVRAELVGGTWMLTDGAKGLYDFGTDGEAAKRAAVVFWKYGFNQIAVVGAPRPTMFIPLIDLRQIDRAKSAMQPAPAPLAVLNDATKTSLLLPGDVYAGPKVPFDPTRMTAVRQATEWTLTLNEDVLGRFGSEESTARSAMKAIKDAKPTEVARIGEARIPLFLANSQPIHAEPLGIPRTTLRSDRMKVQKVRESYWLFEDARPVLEVGTKFDAELLLKVIRTYDLKNLSFFGRPEAGGLKFLTAGR